MEAHIANDAMYATDREGYTFICAGNNDTNGACKLEEEEIDHEMDLSCSNDASSIEASIVDGAMDTAAREGDTAVGAVSNDANSPCKLEEEEIDHGIDLF